MTAVASAARSTSLLEAILGVLYMAVLISRLIKAYHATEMTEAEREREEFTRARRGIQE